jgi:zinc transporter, ZIP family
MDLETAAWLVAPGLATGIGAVFLLLLRRPHQRLLDALVGFTGGIMLAAMVFSLLMPALDRGSLADVVIGFAVGFVVLAGVDAVIPHLHHLRDDARDAQRVREGGPTRQAVLMLSAMTIHNVPEGLAVGVAFGAGGMELGIPIAIAIGVQNVPEGFAAGAPLMATADRVRVPVLAAAATGLVEPVAAFVGYAAVASSTLLLPGALAFAAGAMLYVVVDELVPDSHAHGNEQLASLGMLVGFVVMLVLDVALA